MTSLTRWKRWDATRTTRRLADMPAPNVPPVQEGLAAGNRSQGRAVQVMWSIGEGRARWTGPAQDQE